MLRIVNSPFGRVLQAIRENEFRAEAIGYRVVVYRTTSSILSALFATLAGAMLAIWLRYNGPDTSLSFEIMLDVLLIVVIGGMGTIYGAAIGSSVFVVAQSYLQDLLKLGQRRHVRRCRGCRRCCRPTAGCSGWALLFVLSVYYFPTGIVGRLRAIGAPGPSRKRGPDALRNVRTRGARHAIQLLLRHLRRPRDPLHRVGIAAPPHRHRLAWPGAHRPRHGRTGRASFRTASA